MVNLVKKLMGKTPQKKVLNNNSILLVGLWNPDKKYKNTRHNIGADTLLKYIEKKGTTFKTHKSGMYRSADISINDTEATILTPMVSMNNSGDSVRDYLKNTNIAHDNVVIIYDDIDLAFGRLRLKQGSSDGGHNGIKSIDRNINKDNYWKLKIGVGRPPKGVDPAHYVLSKFNNEEREEVEFIIEDAIEVIEVFSTSREEAVKKASERRIIDVI
jgi:PTH1 family peptidyl-tRNA hydrolase